jgi:hypothetical protein
MMLRLWRGFGMRAVLIVIPMSITPIVVARPERWRRGGPIVVACPERGRGGGPIVVACPERRGVAFACLIESMPLHGTMFWIDAGADL